MKLHEFYQEYANTPIPDRTKDLGGCTLLDIYVELHDNPTEERKEDLLGLAEIYYSPKKV